MTGPRDRKLPPPEDSVVIMLPAASKLAAPDDGVAALITALCASPKRLSVVILVPSQELAETLERTFPKAVTCPPRPGLTLGRLRARAILRIAPDRPAPAGFSRLLRRAIRRDIPVFAATETTARLMPATAIDRPLAALSRSAADHLPVRADLAETADHLISAMGMERGDGPLLDTVSMIAQSLVRGPAGGLLSPMVHRFADSDALCTHLGRPQTIMCLGNGPTCADPRLAGLPHDVLFRVNHQWMEDGYMTGADILFAGVKKSMRAAGSRLIAVASRSKERSLLGVRLLTPWRGRLRYVVVEDIADVGDRLHGHPRPTTGAVMLAAAVALAPRRLIVAGMDMFSNKGGAYPGRPDAVNAYAISHDKDTDAAFIREHLARYDGEIVSLSPEFTELARSVGDSRFVLVEPRQG